MKETHARFQLPPLVTPAVLSGGSTSREQVDPRYPSVTLGTFGSRGDDNWKRNDNWLWGGDGPCGRCCYRLTSSLRTYVIRDHIIEVGICGLLDEALDDLQAGLVTTE